MHATPYMTVSEAAAYARVTPRTVRRHISDGTLTRHNFGGRLLIDLRELNALITGGAK